MRRRNSIDKHTTRRTLEACITARPRRTEVSSSSAESFAARRDAPGEFVGQRRRGWVDPTEDWLKWLVPGRAGVRMESSIPRDRILCDGTAARRQSGGKRTSGGRWVSMPTFDLVESDAAPPSSRVPQPANGTRRSRLGSPSSRVRDRGAVRRGRTGSLRLSMRATRRERAPRPVELRRIECGHLADPGSQPVGLRRRRGGVEGLLDAGTAVYGRFVGRMRRAGDPPRTTRRTSLGAVISELSWRVGGMRSRRGSGGAHERWTSRSATSPSRSVGGSSR